jgi:hypothetical protein
MRTILKPTSTCASKVMEECRSIGFGNSGLELERGKAVYLLAPSYAGGDAGICRIETERLMCWARRG